MKCRYIFRIINAPYKWTRKNVSALFDDIDVAIADSHRPDYENFTYRVGSVILHKNDGKYDIVDGQQRLTALFLLLNYLKDLNFIVDWGKNRLSYECRERSNFTLNYLSELTNDGAQSDFEIIEKIEQSLIDGKKIIEDKFRKDGIKKDEFIAKLKKVILYRIEVPQHTDLNRYFEVMNVRGEQLEQHDILKATLMKSLDKYGQKVFSTVWDACRDMTGYVQTHFRKEVREVLFGSRLEQLVLDPYEKLYRLIKAQEEQKSSSFSYDGKDSGPTAKDDKDNEKKSILDIIQYENLPTPNGESNGEENENGAWVRFDSVIGFTYFLLHVLKVFADKMLDKDSCLIPDSLDDKKLLDVFKAVIVGGKSNGGEIDEKNFSKSFIDCLLKCRFLFDKYIIKREYKKDNLDVAWSIKELAVGDSKENNYYINTVFSEESEANKTNLMLQSCFRVSYTSPKTMHWITKLLIWLCDDNNRQNLSRFTEDIIKENIGDFLKEGNFLQGVGTPHIVLNYLDYLLWTERNNEKYKGLGFERFSFEFRNSVEHWYPQHPPEQSFEEWPYCDRFGNLCIIKRNINSRFSNLSPASKKNSYRQTIEKGSLKLRVMSKETTDDEIWRDEKCALHEKEMLNLLRTACHVPIIP